jgi:hypothetical protein
LREGRRSCRVEGDIPFDFLKDLVNVAVKHAD